MDNFEVEKSGWRISGPALVLSLLVHLLALAAAITLRPEPLRDSGLTDPYRVLEIGFRPAPAPMPVIESIPPAPEETVEDVAPVPNAEAVAEPEISPTEEPVEPTEAASSPAEESVRSNTAVSIPRMPDVLTVRDSVQAVGEAQRQQIWQSDCNPLEEEAGIKDCGPARSSGFGRLDYNATYQSLNGPQVLTRTQQALPAIKANRQQMLDALRSADIGADTRSIVIQEFEAAITEGTSRGNRAVEHMARITDRSAAAEMAREILGDPWVVEGYRLLQQRKAQLGTSSEP